jgi:hypothetical protein
MTPETIVRDFAQALTCVQITPNIVFLHSATGPSTVEGEPPELKESTRSSSSVTPAVAGLSGVVAEGAAEAEEEGVRD